VVRWIDINEYIIWINRRIFINQPTRSRALWRSGYRARLEILFLRERRFESCQRRSFFAQSVLRRRHCQVGGTAAFCSSAPPRLSRSLHLTWRERDNSSATSRTVLPPCRPGPFRTHCASAPTCAMSRGCGRSSQDLTMAQDGRRCSSFWAKS
jgi:hypothetical protein